MGNMITNLCQAINERKYFQQTRISLNESYLQLTLMPLNFIFCFNLCRSKRWRNAIFEFSSFYLHWNFRRKLIKCKFRKLRLRTASSDWSVRRKFLSGWICDSTVRHPCRILHPCKLLPALELDLCIVVPTCDCCLWSQRSNLRR